MEKCTKFMEWTAQHTKDVTSPQTDKCKHHQLAFWGRGHRYRQTYSNLYRKAQAMGQIKKSL